MKRVRVAPARREVSQSSATAADEPAFDLDSEIADIKKRAYALLEQLAEVRKTLERIKESLPPVGATKGQ